MMNLHKKLKSCFCSLTFLCPLSCVTGLLIPSHDFFCFSDYYPVPAMFPYALLQQALDKRNKKSFEAFHSFTHPAAAWVDYPRKWLMVLSVFIHYSKPQDLTVAFVSELMWFCFFRGEERVCFNHMAMNWASFSKKTAHETSFTKTTVKP